MYMFFFLKKIDYKDFHQDMHAIVDFGVLYLMSLRWRLNMAVH